MNRHFQTRLVSMFAASQCDRCRSLPLIEVAALFRAGKLVQTTICYREITGANLKEVRLAINGFAAG